MSTAQLGDTVVVHYTGRLNNGTVFDSSEKRDPLRVKLGSSGLIPGFQDAVVGMETGETKTAKIPPESAYGPHRQEMVVEFGRDKIPPNVEPQVGQALQLQTQDGQPVPAKVVDVSDQSITVDANHPLAGQELTFDIRLVEVVAEST